MKRSGIKIARHLRRNSTDAERALWAKLRNRGLIGVKFRRQFPISGYVLDFFAPDYNLCIEADGGRHYFDAEKEEDSLRQEKLEKLGVRILRFSNAEILSNINGVGERIIMELDGISKKYPSPLSSPQRGEEDKGY